MDEADEENEENEENEEDEEDEEDDVLYSVCSVCFSFLSFTYISISQRARDLPYVVYHLSSPAPSHFVRITLRHPLDVSRSTPTLISDALPCSLPSPFVNPPNVEVSYHTHFVPHPHAHAM